MSGNDEDNGFVTAAAAFVDAERELRALHSHAQELAAAGESIRTAELKASAMVDQATDALGEARARLVRGAEENRALSEQVSTLISSLTANVELIASLVENVTQLDPGKIRRDLDDMTRSLSDNAAELREVRRELSDVRRDSTSLSDLVRQSGDQSANQFAEVRREIDSVASGQRTLSTRLMAGLVLVIVLVVAAIAVSL